MIPLIFIIFGTFITIAYIQERIANERLLENGVEGIITVIEVTKERYSCDNGSSCFIRYNTKAYLNGTSKKYHMNISNFKPFLGQQLNIRYDENNPELFVVVEEMEASLGFGPELAFILMFPVVGMLVLWLKLSIWKTPENKDQKEIYVLGELYTIEEDVNSSTK